MPISPIRSDFRLDQICTVYDVTLGTEPVEEAVPGAPVQSTDPYSVREIETEEYISDSLVLEWEGRVARQSSDESWFLSSTAGDGYSWLLFVEHLNEYGTNPFTNQPSRTFFPLEGLFPLNAKIVVDTVTYDIESFSVFGTDLDSSIFEVYGDQPRIKTNGDALFESGTLDGGRHDQVTGGHTKSFSGVIVNTTAAVPLPDPIDSVVDVTISTGLSADGIETFNLIPINPVKTWCQVANRQTFPLDRVDGVQASLATFEKTLSLIMRTRIKGSSVIRFEGQIYGVLNVTEADSRGRFWQVDLVRKFVGFSV